MPVFREHGPYIHPSWLPRFLVGMDRCEWKVWFQAQHDGRSWTRIKSDFDQVRYNIRHTELMRRCTDDLETQGFDVTTEYQNEFRIRLQSATLSGRPDLIGFRGDEALVVDAKAAQPSQAHQAQVMLYIMLLHMAGDVYRDVEMSGQVYYGEDNKLDVAGGDVDEEFRNVVTGLIGRLAAKEAPRKVPSYSECRFCPIPRDYCPEKIEG